MNTEEILICLPAYNEARVIGKVISSIRQEGYPNILVVDDGSQDNTAQEARDAGAMVLSHPINRGAGAATATGLEFASRENKYSYLVFMDADGQHSYQDLRALLSVAPNYDVVIGSRHLGSMQMPFSRRLANAIGSIITFIFFGLYVKDSQSGFKVFNRKAMHKVQISFDRYEFCSEIIGEIYQKHLSYKEVPIKVIYTNHSKAKGQSIGNGFKMVLRFIFRT